MNRDSLVHDLIALLSVLNSNTTKSIRLFLIGHSMGGAIAVWIANLLMKDCSSDIKLMGLFLIDIVEEIALASIDRTRLMLMQRPQGFETIELATKWAIKNRVLNNPSSARLSLISQLRETTFEERDQAQRCKDLKLPMFVWRTDLLACSKHWSSWVEGMSKAFVDLNLPNKTILLAGIDTLDKTLLVGHKQGKFRLLVFSDLHLSHFVHEDAPERTGEAINSFFQFYNNDRMFSSS